jgi:V8-like Glu-specific endopeptidase
MTAGHCVYNHEQKAWATQIEVSPGTDARSRPYGSQKSADLRSVDKWVNDQDNKYDLGAIILPNDKFGKELGYFGFQALSTKSLKATELNTAGYPGDKPRGTLWFMAGPVSKVDCAVISYMIDTYGGQSGSPVWTKIDDKRVAVGIHVRGGCPNQATRIRKPVFDMMMHWTKQ